MARMSSVHAAHRMVGAFIVRLGAGVIDYGRHHEFALSLTPRIGDRFQDRYEIESLLGEGGFAQVFLARQTDLERRVALKILRPGKLGEEYSEEANARHESFAKRFEREAKMISRLRDPHTVIMYDYGRDVAGQLFMVLEFVDGLTASQLVKAQGAIEAQRVVYILEQVLRSLREAHSLGVLHRDIKPQNIMLFEHMGERDQVKVLDFGIAKPLASVGGSKQDPETELTGADGMLVGTPRYMSPEQIRGDDLTPASDLYSLGLVVYELLLGKKAVEEPTTIRIIARHLSAQPIALPDAFVIAPRLREIVHRMLQKEPHDRYQSADEVLHDLAGWDRPVDVTQQSPMISRSTLELIPLDEETPARSGGRAPLLAVVLLCAVGVVLFLGSRLHGDAAADPSDGSETRVAEPVREPISAPVELVEVAEPSVEPIDIAEPIPEPEPPEPAEVAPAAEPEVKPVAAKKPKPKPRDKPPAPKPAPTFLPVE